MRMRFKIAWQARVRSCSPEGHGSVKHSIKYIHEAVRDRRQVVAALLYRKGGHDVGANVM